MDESTTQSAQDDPDPPPKSQQPSGDESPTTFAADAVAAVRKEKGRVRFNSNAAAITPPPLPSPISLPKPRPSVLRGNSSGSVVTLRDMEEGLDPNDDRAIQAAQQRAREVAARLQRVSTERESRASEESTLDSAGSSSNSGYHSGYQNIPLQNMGFAPDVRHAEEANHQTATTDAAYNIVRSYTTKARPDQPKGEGSGSNYTPIEMNDGQYDGVYNVPAPEQYRPSVLSQLLKLGPVALGHSSRTSVTSASFGGASTVVPGTDSGTTTPARRKWYEQNQSQDTLANLIGASARLANPNITGEDPTKSPPNGKRWSMGPGRPGHKRTGSDSRLKHWQKEEARITVHIAETLSRQEYIKNLCRCLMLYGAPTHRLEEYLAMTARVLEIDGQFLYLPGCMVISFDDKSTHTAEIRIVRTAQGIDLGKLKDVHKIYKEVMHDVIGVEEASAKLHALMTAKEKFNPWFRVLIFGLTSLTAAPFSFKARLIDLPLTFCFGSLVGFLQLIVAPKSNLYSNVFEVSATVVISFLARAFGSIRGGDLFCFSSMAQGGIVMLLPGYAVLCSSLELQSRAIVPGSIRIVYAVIYSLLLGFGITVGASLYGLFDRNATSATTCENPLPPLYGFIFVPFFVLCISVLYQAKWRQMPIMVVIAFAGYVVNYFSSLRFAASPQIASTLGALSVGILANLYSRLRHGVAAAILIPAIFTQVPGGLASTGGLLSGLSIANQLTDSTQPVNGTGSVQVGPDQNVNTVVFDVAASMIQIAIGIAVGLFLSALLIYPLGKRRSGLFSF